MKTIIAGINPSDVNRHRSHVSKLKKISTNKLKVKVSPSKYRLQNRLDGCAISQDSNTCKMAGH